jgi:formate/nitrite transporter FocA (FNT family)
MAPHTQDLTGKFVGIWLPISAFAAIGFEHCIANMFVVSNLGPTLLTVSPCLW